MKNLARGNGSRHSAVVTNEGNCFVWGNNDEGQLGLGHQENQFKPILLQGFLSKIK